MSPESAADLVSAGGCVPIVGRPVRYLAGVPEPPRCLVMGVVNVTPDSFSDGGMWLEPTEAIAHGRAVTGAGADLVDVGGESTRPGAERPSVPEELRRVLPVVGALSRAGVVVSIDTMRAEVARAAVDAGATVVNDVSGGLADDAMLPTVAELGVGYIAMHWRGHSTSMQQRASYDDLLGEVTAELGARAEAALAAGISPQRLALDPGIGFAKTGEPQLDAAASPRRPARPWLSLGRRIVAQDVPRRFAGRGRRDATTTARARRRLGRVVDTGGPRRCMVRPGARRRALLRRRSGGRSVRCEGGSVTTAVEDVLAVHADFYAAFESADFDAMADVWADDDGVVCVHPAAPPIRGRAAVMRSWLALMASAPYIQFFLTDVEVTVTGELATVTCMENVLSAGADTPLGVFAGGTAVATNVFRNTSDGWRLWVHHASPVLSSTEPQEEEAP